MGTIKHMKLTAVAAALLIVLLACLIVGGVGAAASVGTGLVLGLFR